MDAVFRRLRNGRVARPIMIAEKLRLAVDSGKPRVSMFPASALLSREQIFHGGVNDG